MAIKTLSQAQKELYLIPFEKLATSRAWFFTSVLVRNLAKGRCYTCGSFLPFDKLCAGHAIEKRGHAGIYFDLDCLRGQCYRCNRYLHGNHAIFAEKLLREIGEDRFKEMHQRSQISKVYTKADLERITEDRKEMINKLQEQNG